MKSASLRRTPTSTSTLARYQSLDQVATEALGELLALIADVAGVSRCMVGLADQDRQWIRVVIGIDADQAALYVPLCAYVIYADGVVVAPDARLDAPLAEQPVVQMDGGVRLFAGAPLRDEGGLAVGALCLFDTVPRALPERTIGLIPRFARQVEAQIQLRRRLSDVRDKHLDHLRTLQMLRGLLRAATTFAIMGTDARGRLTTFSEGAERMFGVRASEVVGVATPLVFLDPGELSLRGDALSIELGHRADGFEVLVAPCRDGEPKAREWTMRRPAGSSFPASIVVAPMLGEAREITGFVVIAQDITEQKAIEQMKDDFVSTVSHELRTPLTAILGSLGLALGGVAGEVPPALAELLTIAHSNGDRLLRLVNDILDLRKLESGRFELHIERCDLSAVTARAVELTRPVAELRGVRLAAPVALSPLFVHADFERLVQVLVNLLSNAAKFSPPGEEVRVELGRRPGAARISVSDRGPGIPEDFKARIFTRFAQASTSDATYRGGTGLGLSVVKSIVELHRGSVSFETELGCGTTFHIDLPELQG